MRTLFLFLVTCLPCLAQFGVEQPFFASRSTVQTSITNDGALAYYWNYLDATNVITTNWFDRIQGLPFKSYNPPNGPLLNSEGLWFTNMANLETVMTNVPIPRITNSLFGIIFRPTAKPGGGPDYNTYIGTTNTESLWTLFRGGGGTPVDVDWGAPASPNWAHNHALNKMSVIMFSWSNTIAACWTNGFFSKSLNFGTTPNPAIKEIGGAQAQFYPNHFLGAIKEVGIWTNIIDPQPYVSNYWYYATNTYGIP